MLVRGCWIVVKYGLGLLLGTAVLALLIGSIFVVREGLFALVAFVFGWFNG